MEDKKLMEGKVPILMLTDNLGHGRISEKTDGLVLEGCRKETSKLILSINLNKQGEVLKPNPKRPIVSKSMGRRDIETKVKMMTDQAGVPGKEGFSSIIDGHVVLQGLEVLNIEPVSKCAQEESLIHEAKIG